MATAYTEVRIGDEVRMRKAHPCGSDQWRVVRLGADIGMVCSGCGRKVLLPRPQFMRQVKTLLKPGPVADQRRSSEDFAPDRGGDPSPPGEQSQ